MAAVRVHAWEPEFLTPLAVVKTASTTDPSRAIAARRTAVIAGVITLV
jgi:hypothetical protein